MFGVKNYNKAFAVAGSGIAVHRIGKGNGKIPRLHFPLIGANSDRYAALTGINQLYLGVKVWEEGEVICMEGVKSQMPLLIKNVHSIPSIAIFDKPYLV